MAEQFTKWYLSRLHAAPRRVKAATYFCTRSLQEFLCRAIQGKQLGSQETLRSVAGMGVYGAVISSTLSIETQRALEACCPKGWVWTRWAMQNFVVMPFLVSASCGFKHFQHYGISKKSIASYFIMLRKSLPKIMPNLWKVYFPAVYIIQNYIPPRLWFLGFQFLSFCIGLKLNLDQSRKLATKGKGEKGGKLQSSGNLRSPPNWRRVKEELSSDLSGPGSGVARKHSHNRLDLAQEGQSDELFSRRAARLATPRQKRNGM